MCGIFAYLNYDVSRERRYILEVLFNGLRRLEYRGYDSAGISIDSCSVAGPVQAPCDSPLVFRQEGNIESLVKSVYQGISICVEGFYIKMSCEFTLIFLNIALLCHRNVS